MGTMTITVDEDIEERFRKHVAARFGRGKGVLGKAVSEAIDDWIKKGKSIEKCLQLLEKGIDMGKMTYKSRDELHDRGRY
ncbi:MAG: hypothetical protein ABIH34_06000 [Nanoarchaeota archaeon]